MHHYSTNMYVSVAKVNIYKMMCINIASIKRKISIKKKKEGILNKESALD